MAKDKRIADIASETSRMDPIRWLATESSIKPNTVVLLPTTADEGVHLEVTRKLLDIIQTRPKQPQVLSEIEALARRTQQYSICCVQPAVFEVMDDRRLLDGLLLWDAVTPDESTGLPEFEKLRKKISEGPTLNEADRDLLDWLCTNAECYANGDEDGALILRQLHASATAFRGSEEETKRFLLAELR